MEETEQIVIPGDDTVLLHTSDIQLARGYNLDDGTSRLVVIVVLDGVRPRQDNEPAHFSMVITPESACRLGVDLARTGANALRAEQEAGQ